MIRPSYVRTYRHMHSMHHVFINDNITPKNNTVHFVLCIAKNMQRILVWFNEFNDQQRNSMFTKLLVSATKYIDF